MSDELLVAAELIGRAGDAQDFHGDYEAVRDLLAAARTLARAYRGEHPESPNFIREGTMRLFKLGEFGLASGESSDWKIDCDALRADDWEALAAMAARALPPFCHPHGVPRGGIPFAAALRQYATADPMAPILVCEDVLTTGRSISKWARDLLPARRPADPRPGLSYIGVCVFARGPCPAWVTPLFQCNVR